MRKVIYRVFGIAALLALTGCAVYADPYPRHVYYYQDSYYGPDVVVVGGGYYRGGYYYRHYR